MKFAPLRAATRIAWRSARRNVRRTALVVVMVALPVALATATATMARTIVGTPEDAVAATMGRADLTMTMGPRFDRGKLRRRLPAGSRVVSIRRDEVTIVRRGELLYTTLLEPGEGLEHPVLDGMYALTSGRAPRAPGEAAVNQRALDAFGVDVGDDVELGGYRLKVTGVVLARDFDSAVVVVGTGTLRGRAQLTIVLADLPAGSDAASVIAGLESHGHATRAEIAALAATDATTSEAVSVVGGVLALFCTGLVAAAAFVVGARRQLRELGLVGAVGGERRHVRAVVWLGGSTLGLLGAGVGMVLGLSIALAVRPLVPRFVGRTVGPLAVNPVVLGAVVAMAVIAATLAALAPARAVAKSSVMDALRGRMPPPRRPGRLAASGVVILVAGGGVTAWATITFEDDVLAAGVVAMLIGVLLAVPLLVATIGRFTRFFPATGRLAARDAARHGRKTGAAVAAGVLALAVPVAVSAYSLSEEAYERSLPRLLDTQLLVGTVAETDDGSSREPLTDLQEGFPDASIVPLAMATAANARRPADDPISAMVSAPDELGGETTQISPTMVGWPVFVGDAALLRALGAREGVSALDDGHALVLGGYEPRNGFVRIRPGGHAARARRVPATAVDSPRYLNESIPKIVVARATATRLGLESRQSEHLLTSSEPLSAEDVARARAIVARHPGVFVKSNEDYLPPYALGRAAATAASLPLALAILAVAVALVASESRRSHQVLVAVGAGPFAHRKLVAATAALLAATTAVLAVPAGFLPTAVIQVASQSGRPVVIPWTTIAIVVVVVPILSAIVAAAASRTPRVGSLLTPAT
ncbi:MAG TPA: FtsX-like permease family protein [Actinomycetota bacterium]|nr:FtsX-like permease family protein [Actinomycetota bacterium]